MIRRNPDIVAVLLVALLLAAGARIPTFIHPPTVEPGLQLVIDRGLTGLTRLERVEVELERQAGKLERHAHKLEQRLADLPLRPLNQ